MSINGYDDKTNLEQKLDSVGSRVPTLRQYYAVAAMQALIRNTVAFPEGFNCTRDDITIEAFRQADSMIAFEESEEKVMGLISP